MSSECDDSGEGRVSGHGSVQKDGSDLSKPPSINTIFSILAHPHRRYALDCLREHHEMTLADVADEVAVREYEQPLDEVPAETVKRIYLGLYHKHIPKLEAANMVEYSQSRDSVAVDQAIGQVVPFLELVDDEGLEAV